MEQIRITNLRSHVQIEWPDGTIHTAKGIDWHSLLNAVADTVSPVVAAAGDMQYTPEGAGELQYGFRDALVAFCDLHGVIISYGLGNWSCTKNNVVIAFHSDLNTMFKQVKEEMTQ